MIVWKTWGVRIADYFFDEEPVTVRADFIRYHQRSSLLADCECTPFNTRVIDLQQSPDQILGAMYADNRRQIRRAEKQDSFIYCHLDDTPSLLQEVCGLHDKFTALKRLPGINRARLWALQEAGLLDISLVRDPNGDPLFWSTYYRNSRRARGLHGGSLYRAVSDRARKHLIGRAHRYGVWRDILRFKNAGLVTFDFGGWYTGRNDVEKLRINLFKREFGGVIEQSFNCVCGVTLRAKLILALLALRDRWPRQKHLNPEMTEGGAGEAPKPEYASRETKLSGS